MKPSPGWNYKSQEERVLQRRKRKEKTGVWGSLTWKVRVDECRGLLS